MPQIVCALESLVNQLGCSKHKGVFEAYWTRRTNVDFTAMAADALKFDASNQQVLGYTMLNSATFAQIQFDKKSAFADFTYTDANGFYEIIFQAILKGKSFARRNSLQAAIQCCDILIHIYLNDNTQRVIGVEWNGVKFSEPVELVRVGRHLDGSGQIGGADARDELDLIGQQLYAPLFATVPIASLPLV
jgi:hypothetical protein